MNTKPIKAAFADVFDPYMESQGFLKKAGAYYRIQGDFLQTLMLDASHAEACYVKSVSLPCWMLPFPNKQPYVDLKKHHVTYFIWDSLFMPDYHLRAFSKAVDSTDEDFQKQCFTEEFLRFRDVFDRTTISAYQQVHSEKEILSLTKGLCEHIADHRNVYFHVFYSECLYLCALEKSWAPLEQVYQEYESYTRRYLDVFTDRHRITYDTFEAFLKDVYMDIRVWYSRECPPFSEQDRLFDWIIAKHDEGMLACKELLRIGMPRIAKAFGV